MIPGSKFLLLAVGRRCPANNSPPRERAKRSAAARVAAGTRQQWEVRARDFDDAWTAGRPLIGPRMVAGGFHAHHEAQPAHKTTDPSPLPERVVCPGSRATCLALPYHASHLKHSPSPNGLGCADRVCCRQRRQKRLGKGPNGRALALWARRKQCNFRDTHRRKKTSGPLFRWSRLSRNGS